MGLYVTVMILLYNEHTQKHTKEPRHHLQHQSTHRFTHEHEVKARIWNQNDKQVFSCVAFHLGGIQAKPTALTGTFLDRQKKEER